MAQIGRHKGAARSKRKILSRLSWNDWLTTYLHTWSREIVDWLVTQGVSKLVVTGLETADWPQFKFVEQLKFKAGYLGIAVETAVSLDDQSSERAVKSAVQKRRRQATKAADALRELTHQFGG
jgi:hypothetical protein